MDQEIVNEYRRKHRRCRTCESAYEIYDRLRGYNVTLCAVKGCCLDTVCKYSLGIMGMFCRYYRPKLEGGDTNEGTVGSS